MLMRENGRVIGLGVALVDHKIRNTTVSLPNKREELLQFVDKFGNLVIQAGGPIPNTLTAFLHISKNTSTRLFCCVGSDERGNLFRRSTDQRLGIPQSHIVKPTGIWVGIMNKHGEQIQALSYYGASEEVQIAKNELKGENNKLFITDISSCKLPNLFNQAEIALNQVIKDGGIFSLSLGGARPSSLNREYLLKILSSFKRPPDIVFGNKNELLFAEGTEDLNEAMNKAFPNSELLVITNGGQGSLVRFRGVIDQIPPFQIDRMIDETGAGDSYMGTTLALLTTISYKQWDHKNIRNIAQAASFASSLVIRNESSRLTQHQGDQTLRMFHDLMKHQ